MTDEIKTIQSLVAIWEKKAKQADEMLIHLRAALETLESETAPPSSSTAKRRKPKGAPAPFSTKYGRSAGDYIAEALAEHPMSLRELQDSLGRSGKTYSDQAVMHALTRMMKTGRIAKRPAPPGASAKYIFELTAPLFDAANRRVG